MSIFLDSLALGWENTTLTIGSSVLGRHLSKSTPKESDYLQVCFSAGEHITNPAWFPYQSNCRNFLPIGPPLVHNCRWNGTSRITQETIICVFCDTEEGDRPLRYRYDGRINNILLQMEIR